MFNWHLLNILKGIGRLKEKKRLKRHEAELMSISAERRVTVTVVCLRKENKEASTWQLLRKQEYLLVAPSLIKSYFLFFLIPKRLQLHVWLKQSFRGRIICFASAAQILENRVVIFISLFTSELTSTVFSCHYKLQLFSQAVRFLAQA